jgi:pSer/pThr/pTyr-binding forkhead associated (FHA) protein
MYHLSIEVRRVGKLNIQLQQDKRLLASVEMPADEGYILGRSDEHSDYIPDIDLASCGARELGVSRRHAALVRYHGALHVIDLNSVNGTFLNGKRLIAESPSRLSGQDQIRLGTLTLEIENVL